jgi:ketol-acid reductoisomerase
LGARDMPRRKPDAAGLGEQQGGPQLVDASVQARMRALLARIADGDFAQRFVAAQAGGAPQASRAEAADADMPVAGELRSLLGRDSPSADVGDDEVLADSDDPQIWLS